MAQTQRSKPFAPAREEEVASDNECSGSCLSEPCENRVKIAFGARMQDMDL
jgi:hypothetical protein